MAIPRDMWRFGRNPFRYMDTIISDLNNEPLDWHPYSRRKSPRHGKHHQSRSSPHGTTSRDPSQFKVQLEVSLYEPNEISVKVRGHDVVVEAKHEEREDEDGFISRSFARRIPLPQDVDIDSVQSTMSDDGVLTLTASKKEPVHKERIIPVFPADIHGHKVDHPTCGTGGP